MRNSRTWPLCSAIVFALSAAFPVVAQVDAPKKYAILIGVNHYLNPSVQELKYAMQDAISLKQVLDKQFWDQVIPLYDNDAERDKIVRHLSRIAAIAREQDTFLLYFAGHGVRSRIGKTPTYWLTYDADISQLEVDGIRLTHLLDYVADIKATKKIIILDHCFSGDLVLNAQAVADVARGARSADAATITPLAATARPGIPSDVFNATAPSAGAGTLVIAAARGFAYEIASPDGTSGHGVLTTALLRAFQSRDADTNKDGRLSVNELTEYLRLEVKRLSNNTQDLQTWMGNTVNPETWVVAENLSVDTSEAGKFAARYNHQLVTWQVKNLISIEDVQNGAQVLETWVSSFGTGRALTDTEKIAMDGFRKVMDDATRPDSQRASLVKPYIDAFLGR